MFRFITPIIIIVIAVVGFFSFTNPIYKNISTLKAEVASRNEALDNSKALETERNQLTAKYNAINPDDLNKLQKLLPDNIDNIRLILEIEGIAAPYGMVLKDVKYDTTSQNAGTGAATSVQGGATGATANKDYGIWYLEFSTTGSYNNFLNFTTDLQNNLRIVDISSINFSSNSSSLVSSSVTSLASVSSVYTYDFKIQTYWLKN